MSKSFQIFVELPDNKTYVSGVFNPEDLEEVVDVVEEAAGGSMKYLRITNVESGVSYYFPSKVLETAVISIREFI